MATRYSTLLQTCPENNPIRLECYALVYCCRALYSTELPVDGIRYISAWDDARHGSDECRYDAQGRLLSLRFESAAATGAAGGEEMAVSARFDAYVDAGVLRLVSTGEAATSSSASTPPSYASGAAGQARQLPEEKLDLALSGDIRGGSNYSGLFHPDALATWAANRSTEDNGLSLQLSPCRIEVERLVQQVAASKQSCAAFISLWTVLFCAVGWVGCLHFGRVFFSLALEGQSVNSPSPASAQDTADRYAGSASSLIISSLRL